MNWTMRGTLLVARRWRQKAAISSGVTNHIRVGGTGIRYSLLRRRGDNRTAVTETAGQKLPVQIPEAGRGCVTFVPI